MLDIRENFEQIIMKMLALEELAVFIGENPFATRDFFTEGSNIRENR